MGEMLTNKTESNNKEIKVMHNNTNTNMTKAIKTSLNSNAEEFDYSDNFNIYMRDINKIPLLDKEEEYKLGLRILEGDKDAEGILVEHNLRLAISVAKSYAAAYKLDVNDLVQAANYGLILAADKFDCRVARFSTIAMRYCKAYISKFVKKYNTTLYVSEHDTEVLSRIRSIRQAYIIENEQEPTIEDIVLAYNASTKNPKKHIDDAKAAALLGTIYTTSIDSKVGDDGCKVEDLVSDPNINIFEESVGASKHELWDKAISLLETRKAIIVRLHSGFGCDQRSFIEIGKMLNISGERVRQLFEEGCKEIENGPYSSALRGYSA